MKRSSVYVTTGELREILALFDDGMSLTDVARKVGRSKSTIRKHLRDNGRKPKRNIKWSKVEENQLIELYKKGHRITVISKVLDRTRNQVNHKVSALGKKGRLEVRDRLFLKPETEQFLKENYLSMTGQQIADHFGVRRDTICLALKKLGLSRASIVRPWNDARIAQLRELYPCRSNKEIAEEMGMTVLAVKNMANKLRIRKSPEYQANLKKISRENLAKYRPKAQEISANNRKRRAEKKAKEKTEKKEMKVVRKPMSRKEEMRILRERFFGKVGV